MKLYRAVLCNILLSIAAIGQSGPLPAITPQGILFPLANPPQTVTSATVTRTAGFAGSRTMYYWIVTNSLMGQSLPGGPFVLTHAPNVYGISIPLQQGEATITWQPVTPVTSYDVLRTSTNIPPLGACNCAVATGMTGNSVLDASESLGLYTLAPIEPSAYTVLLNVAAYSAGTAALEANGVPIAGLNFASPPPLGNVTPNTVAATTLTVVNDATIGGTLGVTGNTTLNATLNVTGTSTLAAMTATNVTDSALDSGQCVQAGTGGLLTGFTCPATPAAYITTPRTCNANGCYWAYSDGTIIETITTGNGEVTATLPTAVNNILNVACTATRCLPGASCSYSGGYSGGWGVNAWTTTTITVTVENSGWNTFCTITAD